MHTILFLLNDAFFAAIPAIGFALLFHVPKDALKYCALLGALGHLIRTALMHYMAIPLVFSTFFAATTIGIIGVMVIAPWFRAHPKVFTVPAIIPMIPGVFAYRAMISLINIYQQGFSTHLFGVFAENFLNAGFVLMALVFGLALPGLLFYRRRPVI